MGGLGVDGGGDVGVAVVSPGDDAAELPVLLADERSARVAVAGGVAIEAGAELILRCSNFGCKLATNSVLTRYFMHFFEMKGMYY